MLTKAYVHTVAFLESLKKDERGVTAIEYAIIAAAIASVVAVIFTGNTSTGLGGALNTAMNRVIEILTNGGVAGGTP